MVGKVMRDLWWWLMKKQLSLCRRNTLRDSSHNSNNHICNGDQNWLGCVSRWWKCRRYGGGPRQTCQISENMMESNDGCSIFLRWGMSIASKRAKERQNWTPDELVMAKTRIQSCQCHGYPDIRE